MLNALSGRTKGDILPFDVHIYISIRTKEDKTKLQTSPSVPE